MLYCSGPEQYNNDGKFLLDLSSDSSIEDTISSPTNPYFYPAPLGNICSYCGSKTNVSNAEQHCDSLCQARLVNVENFLKNSRPNRLPIFIEITSKDNKVSYWFYNQSYPTNSYFYPAPLGNICSYCGSKTNVSNAEQHCDSLCQARLVNVENFLKNSRPNRLPIFIEITSKDNKVSYWF